MTSTNTFDLSTFTRAIEERDSSAQLALYAQDAQVTLVDKNCQPAAPRVLHGRGEIQTWIEEVCGRDMTHRIQHSVQDEAGAAFTEACRYPDGTAVMCATVLEISDGVVTRQTAVQAWDE
jgi:hypothetical protein